MGGYEYKSRKKILTLRYLLLVSFIAMLIDQYPIL